MYLLVCGLCTERQVLDINSIPTQTLVLIINLEWGKVS